jgi:hypothetical protein
VAEIEAQAAGKEWRELLHTAYREFVAQFREAAERLKNDQHSRGFPPDHLCRSTFDESCRSEVRIL